MSAYPTESHWLLKVCHHDNAQSKEYWELIGALMRTDEHVFISQSKKATPAHSQMSVHQPLC